MVLVFALLLLFSFPEPHGTSPSSLILGFGDRFSWFPRDLPPFWSSDLVDAAGFFSDLGLTVLQRPKSISNLASENSFKPDSCELALIFVWCIFTGRCSFCLQSLASLTRITVTGGPAVVINRHVIPADQRISQLAVSADLGLKKVAKGLRRFCLPADELVSTTSHIHAFQLPTAVDSSPPAKHLMWRRHGQQAIPDGRKELGFPYVGLAHIGPICFSAWSISRNEKDGPPVLTRPRSVLFLKLTYSFAYLRRHNVKKCRGLFSQHVLALIQGSVELSLMVFDYASLLFDLEGLWCPSLAGQHFLPYSLMPIISSFTEISSTDRLFTERPFPHSSFTERSLPHSSFTERSLPSSSFLKERTFLPYRLSMRGQSFPVAISGNLFNFFTVLSSCVAVCTGPEDATGLVATCFGGKSWFSTSQHKVTKFQHSGLTGKCLPTHLNFVSNSLSFSPENLSALTFVVFKDYGSNQRGWLIPSCCCKFED